MFIQKRTVRLRLLRETSRLLLSWTIVAFAASAQVNPSQSSQPNPPANARIAQTLTALKTGNLAEADIDLLVRTGAVQAIPDLKKQFVLTEDPGKKGRIASALVRLGDKEPAWWNYLAETAEEAVNSDAPSVVEYDANGKIIPGPSSKFLAWAKVHSLKSDAALQKTELDMIAVAFLGESRDPRAIPLLRQALLSPNYLMEIAAARGLAQLQDKASIPLIVQACEAAPADVAFGIASGLLDFHTPEAENAAKRFRPDANAK